MNLHLLTTILAILDDEDEAVACGESKKEGVTVSVTGGHCA